MAFRDTPAMCLRAAYLTMHRQFQRLFRAHGATADQFVLLTLLSEEDGVTQKELVRRSFSDANTITAMLRRLEQRGLVERRPHERDGRAVTVHLSAEGRALQGQLVNASRSLHQTVEATLSDENRAIVVPWMQSLAHAMTHVPKHRQSIP